MQALGRLLPKGWAQGVNAPCPLVECARLTCVRRSRPLVRFTPFSLDRTVGVNTTTRVLQNRDVVVEGRRSVAIA